MIHIFIGTKAQYVKTAPIIREFDQRKVKYNLIDSGQHAHIAKQYREFFNIRQPDYFLRQSNEDIKTVLSMLTWFFSFLCKIIFQPKKIYNDIFQEKEGICLIHGDTPTTLLSALAAKRVGIKVAHLESGLRSFNLFHPFPEEIIRILTMRISDILFAPNEWSLENLRNMNVKGEKVLIDGNTNIDVLRIAREKDIELPHHLKERSYAVFSIHRVETILNKQRLSEIVKLAKKIAESTTVLFCLHPPTKKKLKQYKLLESLKNASNIITDDLLPYPIFIKTISDAKFLVTDGGSVQEESYFLNVPCLVMRNCTERMEGINQNVCLSNFDHETITFFLENIHQFSCSDYREIGQKPSAQIVNSIINNI